MRSKNVLFETRSIMTGIALSFNALKSNAIVTDFASVEKVTESLKWFVPVCQSVVFEAFKSHRNRFQPSMKQRHCSTNRICMQTEAG